jgi:hypothetical protein
LEPKAGLVIRYDFLWRREHAVGAEHGSKDRPSAVVMVVRAKEDGRRRVVVCPITHTPPAGGQSAVEIPTKLARHLGLDDQKMWIKTDAVNLLDWEVGKIPFGVSPASQRQWAFGMLPKQIGEKMFAQVLENVRNKSLQQIRRDGPE